MCVFQALPDLPELPPEPKKIEDRKKKNAMGEFPQVVDCWGVHGSYIVTS